MADTDTGCDGGYGSGANLSAALLAWYDGNRRSLPWRDDPSPYHVWISEIMLQQTRVEAVKGYYARFLARFPDIPSLAEAPEDDCLKLWEGLGYYSRARNLRKAAQQIVADHGGQMPQTAKDLQKLPGIGPYTAAAIASITFGERVPAVDGNLLRIFARLALYETDIRTPAAAAAARAFFLTRMPPDRPGDFNQALMDLGSLVCTPGEPACLRTPGDLVGLPLSVEPVGLRPAVEFAGKRTPGDPAGPRPVMQTGAPSAAYPRCPLAPFCRALPAGRCADLPVMPKKKPRGIEKRTILVIRDADRVLLRRRPARGLLAGLYEFPNIEGWLDKQEALEKARVLLAGCGSADLDAHSFHCGPLRLRALPESRHIFTHKEWHMRGYEIRLGSPYVLWDETENGSMAAAGAEAGYVFPGSTPVRGNVFFAPLRKLQEKYAIPSAFAAYMPPEDI